MNYKEYHKNKFAIYQTEHDKFILEIWDNIGEKHFYYNKTEKDIICITDILEGLGFKECSPDFYI